jgi:membrane protease YdiL (CAAX protease family)
MFKLHAAWFMQFIYPASICVLSKGWSAASCAIYLPSIFITVAEFFCFLVFPTDTNGGKHICFIMRVIGTTFMCVWWLRLRLFQIGNILELVHFWRSLLLGFFGFLFWILLPTLLHCTGLQRHRLPQLTNGRAPFVWNPSLMTSNVALKMLLLGFKIFHSVFLVPFIEEIQVRNLGFRFMTLWLCGRSSELGNWLLDVSLYEFCWPSIIIISLGFGCCHIRYEFEWLAGFLYGLMVQVVAIKDKNVVNAILVHCITNLCLNVYILMSGNFYLW